MDQQVVTFPTDRAPSNRVQQMHNKNAAKRGGEDIYFNEVKGSFNAFWEDNALGIQNYAKAQGIKASLAELSTKSEIEIMKMKRDMLEVLEQIYERYVTSEMSWAKKEGKIGLYEVLHDLRLEFRNEAGHVDKETNFLVAMTYVEDPPLAKVVYFDLKLAKAQVEPEGIMK